MNPSEERASQLWKMQAVGSSESIGEKNAQQGALKSGGDGGNFDGMEARVARLEAQLDAVSRDITDLKIGQATLVERSQHLATKADLEKTATRIAVIIVALTAVITIAAQFIPNGN